MKALFIIGMCLLTLFCYQTKSVSAQSPANRNAAITTVKSFYQYHRASSNIFNKRQIEARKKWFSEDLYGLFVNELKLEKEYLELLVKELSSQDS